MRYWVREHGKNDFHAIEADSPDDAIDQFLLGFWEPPEYLVVEVYGDNDGEVGEFIKMSEIQIRY